MKHYSINDINLTCSRTKKNMQLCVQQISELLNERRLKKFQELIRKEVVTIHLLNILFKVYDV